MFIRIKKIKGKEYSYVVENIWKGKTSRQKVKCYIGRVFRFSLLNDVSFSEYLKIGNAKDYIENHDKNKVILDLVGWELFKFGISRQEFTIDFENAIIQKNKNNAALMINEGFMCSLTLKNLLEFKAEGDEQADGYGLAKVFVEAGINVPQEIFVELFGKLFKTKQHKADE